MDPGMVILLAVLAGLACVGILVAVQYNALVRLRNHCDESWSGIDTELKRRYDLIPNLVSTVKGYAKHEQDVLERVIQARNTALANTGSPESQARDENALIGQLRQLFALAENYPDLKANQNFLQLQGELVNTEDRIQRARRFYNANVRDLNTRIEVFPSNLIANWFGFQKKELFEVEDAAMRQAPEVKF
ncbi:MAG: LemA family protein [Gemmataceae bacterium]